MNWSRALARRPVAGSSPSVSWVRRQLVTQVTFLLPVILLVAAVSTDRFGIRWHGLNLRLELLTAVLLAVWVLLTRRIGGIRIGVVELCLAGWLAVSAFASLAFSPSPRESLRLTLLLIGMVALYSLTIILVRSADDIVRAAVVWVAAGSVVAGIGIVEAILYVLIDSHAGIAFDGNEVSGAILIVPRLASTMWEANIFGSYLLTVWALAFALSRAAAFQTAAWTWAFRIAMAVSTCGIMLSTTRAVWAIAPLLWIGMAAVAVRWGFLSRRGLLAEFINPGLAGIAAGIALATVMSVATCPLSAASSGGLSPVAPTAGPPAPAANPLIGPGCVRDGSAFFQRFFHPAKASSFTGRVQVAELAFKGWLQSPVFGRGAGSFAYVYGPAGGGWIGNLELHILFDTGAVGFLLLLGAVVAAGSRAARGLARPPTSWETIHFVLFGLLASGVALLVTYQFTEGTWLGFSWVFFGMLAAAGLSVAGRHEPGGGGQERAR